MTLPNPTTAQFCRGRLDEPDRRHRTFQGDAGTATRAWGAAVVVCFGDDVPVRIVGEENAHPAGMQVNSTRL